MNFLKTLRKRTRSARLAKFKHFVAGLEATVTGHSPSALRIIDIGGTIAFWEDRWGVTEKDNLRIRLINTHETDVSCLGRISTSAFITDVNQDATTVTVADFREHDLIFSNSFFEHLPSRQAQQQLAATIAASNVPYFIQVPNRISPIDPHHPFAPFFALYPKSLQVRLMMVSSFGNGPRCRSLEAARAWQATYTPLGLRDMQSLFPDSSFTIERPFAVPMSILASRRTSHE